MSNKIFKCSLSEALSKKMNESVSHSLRQIKKNYKKQIEKDLVFHPKRLSPIDFIVLKVLHGQFGKKSYPAIPIALGVARKTLGQAKRLLSHGSL